MSPQQSIEDAIRRLNEATAAAKEATREAHAANNDLLHTIAAMKETVHDVQVMLTADLRQEMRKAMMDHMVNSIGPNMRQAVILAIEEAEDRIRQRFDKLERTLFGETHDAIKAGLPSLEDVLRESKAKGLIDDSGRVVKITNKGIPEGLRRKGTR